jgi:toxin ParE1/3/4
LSRRISLSRAADQDLDGHFLFIAQDSIETAVRFYEAAQAAFQRLVELPEIGSSRAFLDPYLTAIRMWPIPEFPNHLIFYSPTADGIDVVRVLHAKRDIERVFDHDRASDRMRSS